MIVTVLHPAPVSHVPRRGHVIRHDLVAMNTPVDLREVSLSETTETGVFKPPMGNGPIGRSLAVREHAGRTWIPLATPNASTIGEAVSLASLTEYLSGPLRGSDTYGMIADAFSQTPVSARYDVRAGGLADPARGIPEADLRGNRIEAEGREPAAAAVRAHLDAEILLVSGSPWIRFRPLITFSLSGTVGFDVSVDRVARNDDGHQAYDPADFAQAIDDWHMQATGSSVAAASGIARLHGPVRDSHALLHNLNRLPTLAVASMRRLADLDRDEMGVPRERTSRLLRACEDLALPARLGGIGTHEALPAARALSEAFAFLLRHDASQRRRWLLVRSERHLSRFAIPQAEALNEPADADLDALACLTP